MALTNVEQNFKYILNDRRVVLTEENRKKLVVLYYDRDTKDIYVNFVTINFIAIYLGKLPK